MEPSFRIDKAAHQAVSRTAHEFPEAGAQLFRWDRCPHCHQPLPNESALPACAKHPTNPDLRWNGRNWISIAL